MPYVPFVGPSYVYRSLAFDCQRSINLYPAKSDVGDSKTPSILVGRPGLVEFANVGGMGTRCGHVCKGRAFFVSGNAFYEVDSSGTTTLRGNLNTSSGFVSIADNGLQVCLVDGTDGYIFTLATNAFAEITSAGFQSAATVTFLDGYFIFERKGTNQYFISGLYDGLTYDAADFASAEGSPDNIVGVLALHQNVWLFGENTVEVVFNTGAADFPFQPVQGAFIEYGCAGAGSIAKNANTAFWLGADENGAGVVWMAEGYQPRRVSTQAIEYYLQKYKTSFSLATAYCYQDEGHYFYCLNIPNMPTTLVYDVTMQAWHERSFYNTSTGQHERSLPDFHILFAGKHFVGAYNTGIVYEQNLSIYSDNGNVIRFERTAPHMVNQLNRVFYDSFQLDMQVGVGLDGAASEDTDPQVVLQFSNDGGNTWSSEYTRSAGAIGQYKKRVIWNRLGSARDRVHRVYMTTKTQMAWLGSVINAREASF